VIQEKTTVHRDAFFAIHVTMNSGYSFIIPARGYTLKSWITFQDRLSSSTYNYEEITERVYKHLIAGDPYTPLEKEKSNGRTIEAEAQQENPPKRSRSKAKTEDSAKARAPRKTTTQAGKGKPAVMRKPEVRDVRKPKEDVQPVDNSGTKKPTRTRQPKRSSE
jgi:hypothetical protein